MFADLIVSFAASNDDGDDGALVPVSVALSQNYPNPFNPATTIDFFSDVETTGRLEIYNLLGQHVTVLVDKPHLAGSYTVLWNAVNFPSGIYFCRMEAMGFVHTRKLILVK